MSVEGQIFYPGEAASPNQILILATEYRRAAEVLLPTGRRKQPQSRAPYRLVAIQAIELYLNAFMLARGYPPSKLRGLQHKMAPRLSFVVSEGLHLRKATVEHLRELSEAREYLVSRYGPEMTGTLSQLNRLEATLNEVAEKVTTLIARETR